MNNATYVGNDLEAMSFAENYHKWILSEFAPHVKGTVAEVGAGSGNFTSMLLSTKASELTAFEPSKNMYKHLVRKTQGDIRANAVNSCFDNATGEFTNYFDTVVYVNVLEHIEKDYEELLSVYGSLKDGGKLCIFVPALSWLYSDLDREVGHYRRYHKSQLKKLVGSAGFQILKIKYFDMLGILPWYLVFVLFKKTITGGNVSLYDKKIVPLVRWIESVVEPPVGKNLLLVAQKPISSTCQREGW